jgi:hypothetical protein
MIYLTRISVSESGVFGMLSGEDMPTFATLEHAYETSAGVFAPKLPPGTYTCVKGQHVLKSGPITAFEIAGVLGHAGILIHPGNTEADSEGCVLIGTSQSGNAIFESRDAFNSFMAYMADWDTFQLQVS